MTEQERATLIERWMPAVRGLAGKESHRFGADYDDLVSEGHLALLHAADHFDPERQVGFGTYALTCVKRMMQRHSGNRQRRSLFSGLHPVCCFGEDAEELLEADEPDFRPAAELRVILQPVLAQVTGREKELLRLHFEVGLGLSDIGREWGITRQRVEQLLARTLRRLKPAVQRALAGEDEGAPDDDQRRNNPPPGALREAAGEALERPVSRPRPGGARRSAGGESG